METIIEFEVEESVLDRIDEEAAKIGISRTAFITNAIKHALRVHYKKELTAEDEANAFLLSLADDDEDNNWLTARDEGEGEEPDDSRLN